MPRQNLATKTVAGVVQADMLMTIAPPIAGQKEVGHSYGFSLQSVMLNGKNHFAEIFLSRMVEGSNSNVTGK
jgi:hypothetical protein